MVFPITLLHRNPLTGEVVRTYHKVEAKTRRQAERKRDELTLELERGGGAPATGVTVREFMNRFLGYKGVFGAIEPSTVRGYRGEAKLICRYIGGEKLVSVAIATANDGYALKSVAKCPARSSSP